MAVFPQITECTYVLLKYYARNTSDLGEVEYMGDANAGLGTIDTAVEEGAAVEHREHEPEPTSSSHGAANSVLA